MATAKDYPAPQPMTRSRSLPLAVVAIGLCLVVVCFMLATRGRFLEIVDNFELELSVISMVAVSRTLPALLAAVTLMAVILELIPARRYVTDFCNAFVVVVALITLAIYIAGIFGPLLTLMTALS